MAPRAEILRPELPDALRHVRTEARMATTIAARLGGPSGEVIPALITDLSPSGVLLVIDRRFSSLPRPLPGTGLVIEFHVDEISVVGVSLVVRSIKPRDRHLLEVGCSFIDLGDEARTGIRGKVAASKIARRP